METRTNSAPILGRGMVARLVALLNDWLLFPPEQKLKASSLPIWLAFPALYFAVTLIRGPMVDWYPYPFLDPRGDGGYGGVAAYTVALLLVFLGVGMFLRWWANQRGQQAVAAPAA